MRHDDILGLGTPVIGTGTQLQITADSKDVEITGIKIRRGNWYSRAYNLRRYVGQ